MSFQEFSYSVSPVNAGYTLSSSSNSGNVFESYASSSGGAGQAVLIGSSGGSYGSSGAGQAVLVGSSGGSYGSSGAGQAVLVGGSSGGSYGSSGSFGFNGGQSASYGSSSGSYGGGDVAVRVVSEPVQSFASYSSASSGSSGAVIEAAVSAIENAILSSRNPIQINESEVITVNGETGIWSNKSEVQSWRGPVAISEYIINQDSNPQIIRKQTEQQLVYEQEVAIRYLRPPTPPPPGEIIIRQEKNLVTPPAPPLVIRQQPPRPETPAPLVIREAPPQPPAAVGPKVITISGRRLPPPPRKVVIERLPPMPSKPQAILIERWLPYNQQKRRVIFQRNQDADPIVQRPRNVIVQWEAPQVSIKREFKDLGVIRANPVEYVQRFGGSLKSARELPEIVREIKVPSGVVLAADFVAPSTYELEGDVQALSLIDLDREGLSEYRSYVRSYGSSAGISGSSGSSVSYSAGGVSGSYGGSLGGGSVVVSSSSSSSFDSVLAEIFASADRNSDGRLNVQEAERLIIRLNSRLGRNYGESDARAFVRALDVNSSGFIEFEEFRRAIIRQFAY